MPHTQLQSGENLVYPLVRHSREMSSLCRVISGKKSVYVYLLVGVPGILMFAQIIYEKIKLHGNIVLNTQTLSLRKHLDGRRRKMGEFLSYVMCVGGVPHIRVVIGDNCVREGFVVHILVVIVAERVERVETHKFSKVMTIQFVDCRPLTNVPYVQSLATFIFKVPVTTVQTLGRVCANTGYVGIVTIFDNRVEPFMFVISHIEQ